MAAAGGAPEGCICMEAGDAAGGGWAALPECGHVMHLPCLSQCLEHKPVCPVCREPHFGGPGELLQVFFQTAGPADEDAVAAAAAAVGGGDVKLEGDGGGTSPRVREELARLREDLIIAKAARAAALRREEQAKRSQEEFLAESRREAERARERGHAEAVELRRQLELAQSSLEKEERDRLAKESEILSLKRLYATISSNKELDVSVWRASMQGYSDKAANEVLLNAVAKRDKDYRQLTKKYGESQAKMEAAVARARNEGERDAKARAADLGRQLSALRKKNRALEEAAAEARLGIGAGLRAGVGRDGGGAGAPEVGGAGLCTTIPLGRVSSARGAGGGSAPSSKRVRLAGSGTAADNVGRVARSAVPRAPSFIAGSQAGRLEDVSNTGAFIVEGPDGKGGRARYLRTSGEGPRLSQGRGGGLSGPGDVGGGGGGGGGGNTFGRVQPGGARGDLERFLTRR